LQTAEGAGNRAENTGLGAIADESVAGRLRPHTAQTGAAAFGPHHLQLPLVLVHAGEDDRLAEAHARVVQQELAGEVVRAVDDQGIGLDDFRGARGIEPDGMRAHFDGGVEGVQPRGRQLDFGAADVGQGVERLAVQVRSLEPVAVDQSHAPDPGGREVGHDGNAQAAAAHHQYRRAAQLFLAGRADLLQCHLPRVVGSGRRRTTVTVTIVGVRGVLGMLRAALAVHPTGVAVLIVFLFPDRDAVLHFVDDVAAGAKRLVAVARRNAYPNRSLADLQRPDTVHARGVLHTEARDRLGNDPLALLDRQRLEGFVLEPPYAQALVVIAHPTLEGGIAAAGGVAEPGPQGGLIEGGGGKAEHGSGFYPPATGGMNTTESPSRNCCPQSPNSEFTATRSISGASENG